MSDSLALCYHALSERWPASLAVHPERFERQLRLLTHRGFQGSTFSELVAGDVGGRSVAVTFDDAYRSVIEIAFPILSRLGLPATVFVPTDFVERPGPMAWPGIDQWLDGPHEPELACMSWEQLQRLDEAGWEIGSHTRTHPRLPALPADDLADELEGSRETLSQRLGKPCRSLAYPYGAYDQRVIEAARRAGYTSAGTLPTRLDGRAALRWPRIGIYHADDHGRFRLKVSPLVRRIRATRAWDATTRLRGG